MNLENTIKNASSMLRNNNIISHELDAQLILSDIMGVKREYLFVNNKMIPCSKLLGAVYEEEKDEDGFLYVNYGGESTFG